MFKSMITTALRNIYRNRTFSLINLTGLAVSMSLGLLIIMIVKEQYTFDNFHQDSDRIFRVNTMALRVSGEREPYASVPMPVGQLIKEDYTFTDEVVRLNRWLNCDAVYGNTNVPVHGLFADPSFLTLFNFPLEKGHPGTALNEPNSLVITHEAAEKIFGITEPLGQTLSLSGYGEFVVTGVLKPFLSKTHFDFEILASTAAIPALEKVGTMSPVTDNWNNYYANYVYFKLKEGRSADEAEKALTEIVQKHYAGLKLETRDKGYEFYLQPLEAITPGPELSNQMGNGMPSLLIVFMSVLVGIVMIMACFNYTNLMIAKSLSRAREIGIRKVVGAHRWQVFFQFVGEAVVFALVALVFSYLLLQFLKPGFVQLNIAREFSAELKEDYSIYLYFLLFSIGVGVLAGLLPAGYLSAFKPVKVLKDTGGLKVYSKLTFRKALIVTQFTFSVIFVLVVLVIYNQINFMITKDYGFSEQNIYNVRLQGMEFEKLANEVKSLPGVVSIGGVSHALGTWADRASDYKRNRDDEPFTMRDFIVDEHYIANIGLKFLAGRNFDATDEGEHERHVILNEQALTQFGFSDPVKAVGQSIYADDSVMLTVIGVVQDFNFRPLNYQIGPLALRYNLSEIGWLSASIVPANRETVMASIESIWKKLDPVHEFDGVMMADQIDQAYESAGFFDVLTIVGYISFLTIVLACMGMLGMAMYSTQTRIKEIGVRKVMGASSKQIVVLLSRSFFVLIGIAVLIGLPAAFFLGEQFLSLYAYKIEITPLLMLTGVVIVMAVGILTIGSQTLRAATANPADSLRYE
jgi:putative ABC transport system permease protein